LSGSAEWGTITEAVSGGDSVVYEAAGDWAIGFAGESD
jgi:hypothetical protein